MKKWILIFTLGLFFTTNPIFGFILNVSSTNESCAGNGSITFIPSNTDPAGSITYLVYKLPNTTTPYATLTTTLLNGLSAGTYRVIATETVGATSSTQQIDVVITNTVVPLVYTVQSLNQACSTTSNIVVTTTSGTGVSYEIFQGPMTFPLQSSNTFSGLTVGVYRIRVFDACGTGVVSTFTVTVNPAGLNIGPPVFSNTTPPSCNFTVVTNTITPAAGTVIGYPLTIQYTVNPPGGGAPIVTNTSLPTGNQTSQDISTTIPAYINQTYDYTVSITDACGTNYSNNFIINQNITLAASVIPISCNQNYFTITSTNFTPPFTLNFTGFPAGFNPSAFNATYPGPYNTVPVTFGSSTNPTPFGVYDFSVTDACGRTTTRTMTILNLPPNPVATGTNNGCLSNNGQIVVNIPNYHIVTATVTVAPASYPFPLPHDVSSSIDGNFQLTLNPVPLGDYTIQLTDECGDIILPINVTVPVYVNQGLNSEVRPGCDLGNGSVRVSSLNGKLTSISITAAPAGFAFPLPYNGTSNIATSNGSFYMNGLPAGNYTFSAVDECNFANTLNVAVAGYAITSAAFSLQQNCGTFNIPLNYVSNGTLNETFWLQKLINSSTNTWGHPSTGVVYVDGTIPNSTNSYQLFNNTNNLNISFNGTFRIVRNFTSYNNGNELNSNTVTSIDKSCLEYLSPTLSFNQSLEIIDVNRMPCSSGSLDVIVTANGTNPLHYSLVELNGAPFLLDNGNSNIFVNLAPGIYLLQVEDVCGNIVNRQFDVVSLASLVTIYQPNDLLECRTIITGSEVFDITTVSSTIMGSQSPTDYTLTYHLSAADAQNGVGAITNLTSFNPTTNPQTIYARLIFNQLPSCFETTTFDLIVGQTPKLNLNPNYLSCSTAPITVNASNGNLPTTTYVWSNGTTGPSVTVSQFGVTTLTVTATNAYGTNGQTCTNTKTIDITISRPPEVDHIETVDWTDDENTITVHTSDNTLFEYSLDGSSFQNENIFTGLTPGVYTVYIKDKLGCGIITKEVWLLNYPKFFTPNGDGINETWYIKNQNYEPDFTVYVYDRFGKLMDQFKSNTIGWDGTYNGNQNVATDYWFEVHRQDGRIHRGHFALKR